ncbi:MAG: XRE family transcriptional regulator [Betaproteobacteria bacterium]|jgi:predicted XRE-type DNA-binding protein|nr:XRE family transcriptional regulator [Betaproteobacteria bacterium]
MARAKAGKKIATSIRLRAQLRERIRDRIADLELKQSDAADFMGMSVSQLSRLVNDHDVLSLDRLVEAAEGIGLKIEMKAVRPYARD